MASSNFVRTRLSTRHLRQVVQRPARLKERMQSIWAVTWRPGDYGASFLGKTLRPLGSALMMSQVSSVSPLGERIDLLGIAAQVDPCRAVVSYDDLRLLHHFQRTPFVGAKGRVLSAAPDAQGGHESWIQLALEVDTLRQRAVEHCYHCPPTPLLPKIYLGYGNRESAEFEITPALVRLAQALAPAPWSADHLESLTGARERAQEQWFAAVPDSQRMGLLRQAWEDAFLAPQDPANDTGLWLLPLELSRDVYSASRIFEDFGELVGSPIFNVARKLAVAEVQNPAVDLAAEAGFDLAADLASLAGTEEGCAECLAVEQRLIALVPRMRQRTGASDEISDQDLLNSICDFQRPVIIAPPLDDCSEEEQIRRMRQQLAPHLSECCSDADLLSAVRQPHRPLWAAGLCRVQTLRRNPRLPLESSLQFTADDLGRERVAARCWFDSRQQPANARRRKRLIAA